MVARAVGPVGLVYFKFVAASRFATFLLRLFLFLFPSRAFFSFFALSFPSSAISSSFMISHRLVVDLPLSLLLLLTPASLCHQLSRSIPLEDIYFNAKLRCNKKVSVKIGSFGIANAITSTNRVAGFREILEVSRPRLLLLLPIVCPLRFTNAEWNEGEGQGGELLVSRGMVGTERKSRRASL